jgi:hypothetical protein
MLQSHRFMRAVLTGSVCLLTAVVAQARPAAQASAGAFECVLPYVSGGGMVNIVSPSGTDQVVEITVMNSYRYSIVVPKNSSYSFESPVYEGFFTPVVHGGPISFRSDQPIVVYTVLAEDSVTIQCSEPSKRTKIFVGTAKTGVAMANTTKSPIRVQIFQDNDQTPSLTLTLGAESRKLSFLQEMMPVSGTHTYRFVADGDGISLAVISYDRSPASAIPTAESATP